MNQKMLFFATTLVTASFAKFIDLNLEQKLPNIISKIKKFEEEEVIQEAMPLQDRLEKDAPLYMLEDFNQYVTMMIGSEMHEVKLIPDTRMNDIIIATDDCSLCSTGDDKWTPKHQPHVVSTTIIEYFFQMHFHEAKLNGGHYREMACFDDIDACGSGLYFYGIHKAAPYYYTEADGVFGLGLNGIFDKQKNEITQRFNALEQLQDKGMILDKVFGVYTAPFNQGNIRIGKGDTIQKAKTSSIRFGGYDEKLTNGEESQQIWIHTNDEKSWNIPLGQVHFDYENFATQNLTKALINPGLPFISAPNADFAVFKDKLEGELSQKQQKLLCTSFSWCYVEDSCSNVTPDLPHLAFELGHGLASRFFSLTSESYWVEQIDDKGTVNCHLGVIGSQLSANDTKSERDQDLWILGSLFMQNYYTIFDAESDQPRIGLHVAVEMYGGTIDNLDSESYWIPLAISCGLLMICVTSIFACNHCKKFSEKRTQESEWEKQRQASLVGQKIEEEEEELDPECENVLAGEVEVNDEFDPNQALRQIDEGGVHFLTKPEEEEKDNQITVEGE